MWIGFYFGIFCLIVLTQKWSFMCLYAVISFFPLILFSAVPPIFLFTEGDERFMFRLRPLRFLRGHCGTFALSCSSLLLQNCKEPWLEPHKCEMGFRNYVCMFLFLVLDIFRGNRKVTAGFFSRGIYKSYRYK